MGFTRSQFKTMVALYLSMVMMGLHKSSVGVVAPELLSSQDIPGWSHTTLGSVMALANMMAPPGKLVFGYLSAILSGKKLMLILVPISMGCMFACGQAQTPRTLEVAFAAWRFIFSGALPASARYAVRQTCACRDRFSHHFLCSFG